ncbi:MAG: ribonuclease D [Gemmatimonadetes bacterium]|nr:ribonuclease D [Gemmatimonadota bacterium]MYF71950.1 ribonuclease D [Gemmatimonadota bacterium]MYK53771.1 ribonuclease D [Gemmatimonadota bacterium]
MPLINTPNELETLVNRALDAPCVGIDTEFVWEQTYYPRLGIIQVGLSENDCHLIDAVTLSDLSPLGTLLSDPHTVKILHDAQQDLWILRRITDAIPCNIFDTRCAAGFAGLSSNLSLGNLLRMRLNIQLPKTETRTDWLRRPLSDKQLEYALDDVRFLPALREHILTDIQRRGRENWLAEELRQYDIAKLYDDRAPEEQYTRVKGTGRLSRRDMAIVRELAAWREKKARQVDRPRNRVISDDAIVQIARRKPQSIQSLKRVRGIARATINQYGNSLLNTVQRGLAIDEKNCPPISLPVRPDPFEDARLDLAMAFMRGQCLSEGIDIAMVASRSEVKEFISSQKNATDNPLHTGWRREFLGADLTALLTGKHAIGINPNTRLPNLLRDKP